MNKCVNECSSQGVWVPGCVEENPEVVELCKGSTTEVCRSGKERGYSSSNAASHTYVPRRSRTDQQPRPWETGLLSDYLLSSEDETLPWWAELAVAPKRKGCPCCQPSWEMGGKSGGLGMREGERAEP